MSIPEKEIHANENNEVKIPQAPDAELAIIGALLLNQSVPESTRARLKPSQFFVPSSRKIYETLLALDERGVKLDPIQLCEELRKAGALDQIGGWAYVATLTDRAIRSDLDPSVDLVVDAAEKRRLWTAAMEAARASNNGHTPAQIVEIFRQAIAETSQSEPARLAASWADFDAEQFPQGERIAFAVERGEIALLNALPNAGKTTLALNVAVSLAAGRDFSPIVPGRKERRVLYVDGETRRARLQRDLRTMTTGFTLEETMAVGRNLQIVCEAEINGESLALTRTEHLLAISAEALRVKPDFIVIDTLSSLCPVFNENDNAEQTRKVWRPLQKIARDCDAGMLVNHHVGKRSEDSQTPERVYRGRGASASGGAARAVWLLIPDQTTPGLSTLSCVKAKGENPADVRLQLDANTRWIRTLEAIAPAPTPLEIVIAAVTKKMATSEIVAALKDRFSERSVKTYLTEAFDLGKLEKPKTGVYAPKSAESAESAKDENAQPAQSAQSKKAGVQGVQPSIGAAQPAPSAKPRPNGELSQSAKSALSIEGCTPCTRDDGADFRGDSGDEEGEWAG